MADIILKGPSGNIILKSNTAPPVRHVPADVPFRFNGASGNAYIVFNSTLSRFEFYINGQLRGWFG